MMAQTCTSDGSGLVRAELVVSLQWFVIEFEQRFVQLVCELGKDIDRRQSHPHGDLESVPEKGPVENNMGVDGNSDPSYHISINRLVFLS
jgi:hypothetical protein